MKVLSFLTLILAPLAGCGVPDDDQTNSQELNVNSRYTVESVHLLGLRSVTISDTLRRDLDKLVGHRFDDSALRRLAIRIKSELRASEVKIKAIRGTQPDHLIVDFEVKPERYGLNVARFLYNSKEGWTGDGSAFVNAAGNAFTFGLLSDADSSLERYSGVHATFERKNVFTDRVRLHFEFDSFHEAWNPTTLAAAEPADIYRTRQDIMPETTIVLFQPLELDLGVNFARFRPSLPNQAGSAAKTESANAVVSTLRYHQRWGSEHDEQEQELNGSYSVQYSTNLFDTDDVYSRNLANARYRFRHVHNTVEVGFLAGEISGNAPLFERFVLGNSTTLRGWSKFDLDPLGGSHIIHGSIDYRYRFFQAFYDTGAIWDRPEERSQKQSIGTGFKVDTFQLAVAFPIRSGRAEPIFYAGLNF
ncbi:MAG: BamA/TamA family outer membrane protein [Bryobacteraceae bacterium]|jgi:outer membrane protein assembly factor BamA